MSAIIRAGVAGVLEATIAKVVEQVAYLTLLTYVNLPTIHWNEIKSAIYIYLAPQKCAP